MQVVGIDQVQAIVTTDSRSLVLKKDGTVWSWGKNDHGELGDGTYTSRSTPGQVVGLTDVVAIASSSQSGFSAVTRTDGSVWTWGANDHGQLGDGTSTERHSPAPIAGFSGAVAVSTGWFHGLALKQDGSIWGWGSSMCGQPGNGVYNMSTLSTPIQAPGMIDVH